MRILGVWIDNLSKKEILEKIEFFLGEEKFHQIATVNPEFILRAQNDKTFKHILNGCDLNVADGIGIKYAFARYGRWLKCRMSGVDLMHEILKRANQEKLGVFLACSSKGLSSFEEIKNALKRKYPDILFGGSDNDLKNLHSYIIHNTNYNILLCNFGAPAQEIFIDSVKNDMIRLAIGIGGAFDFETGKIKRAPKIMRKVGLEWLFRLIMEPKYRFKRIHRAVIVFPIKILFSKK